MIGEQTPLSAARYGALEHHFQRSIADADRAHGVVNASAAEPRLCDLEGLARLAEHGIGGYADAVIVNVGLSALILGVVHARDVALDDDAGALRRHDEHRHTLVRRVIRIGHGHHDEERGVTRVRRVPFLTLDEPFVALTPCLAGELL